MARGPESLKRAQRLTGGLDPVVGRVKSGSVSFMCLCVFLTAMIAGFTILLKEGHPDTSRCATGTIPLGLLSS